MMPYTLYIRRLNRRRPAKLLAFLFVITLVLMWHSDAVMAFDPGIHEDLTESTLSGQGFDEDSADEVGDSNFWTDTLEPNSSAAHADNNQLGAASARLRSKRTAIGDSLAACRRRDALDALGEALHTVQDIFSHSNSIDNGHAVDLLNLSNGTAFCDSNNNFAPGGLVSGFFNLSGFLFSWPLEFPTNQCTGMPTGMCCHRELNKDNPGKPNGARHGPALAAAGGATATYVTLVEDDIRSRFSADAAEQFIKVLKRKQRTNYFVIDDTGSMSNDIAGVKASVNAFLDSLVAGDEAPTLGLVSFKDSPNFRGEFCNIEEFRPQINALFASGGGDCPEASNSAMLTALSRFPASGSDIQLKGGRILLATDASARNPGLGPVVRSNAISKGVSIDAILTGDCFAETSAVLSLASAFTTSDNDDSSTPALGSLPQAVAAAAVDDPLTSRSARTQLRALTEQTGGVLFQVSRVEVDDVVPTLLELSDPQTATLLTRRVSITSGEPFLLDVPVDETLTRVTFMVALSRAGVLPNVTVLRPNGTSVSDSDTDVARLRLSSVDSFAIAAPAAGVWRVQVEGEASFVARAFGPTDIRINALRLFDPDAGPPARAEVEFNPVSGQPIVGSEIIADLRMTDSPTNVTVALLQFDGTVIESLVTEPRGTRFHRINFSTPSEDFLIEVKGESPAGNVFVRQVEVPLTPQTVGISVLPKLAVTPPGSDASFEVTITNAANDSATFRLSVTATLGWSISVPGPVTIEGNSKAIVSVSVSVPISAVEGQQNDLTFIVEDIGSPTVRNSTSAAVLVGETNQPPQCENAVLNIDVLWPPNHKFEDIMINGIIDPDGDSVNIAVDNITQDEPVFGTGLGSGNTAPDGQGIGTNTAQVRAERAGTGDGRVYEIGFTANDGKGGQCSGSVNVSVPHDRKDTAVDSGQLYDSTETP